MCMKWVLSHLSIQISSYSSDLPLTWFSSLSFSRHDPPTSTSPTSTHSVPTSFNPLPHFWSLASSLTLFRSLTIRFLDESESPTSGSFQSDVSVSGNEHPDPLADACMGLIGNLSRLRRTGLGWEDKEGFLRLVEGRRWWKGWRGRQGRWSESSTREGSKFEDVCIAL